MKTSLFIALLTLSSSLMATEVVDLAHNDYLYSNAEGCSVRTIVSKNVYLSVYQDRESFVVGGIPSIEGGKLVIGRVRRDQDVPLTNIYESGSLSKAANGTYSVTVKETRIYRGEVVSQDEKSCDNLSRKTVAGSSRGNPDGPERGGPQ